ncbi:AAA family ATPase [Mycetocola saprophilus]|uniref:AAA family ATPase n=1 Tax=Mycetocola saprophilus TaxID=76636 RepID=UPI003BF10C2D
MTFLSGFAFSGYRSFPSDNLAVLHPLGKINLIAGQNNAGKSNVLRVIADAYAETPNPKKAFDRPLGEARHRVQLRRFYSIPEVLSQPGVRSLARGDLLLLTDFLADPAFRNTTTEAFGIWIDVNDDEVNTVQALRPLARRVEATSLAGSLVGRLLDERATNPVENVLKILKWMVRNLPGPVPAFTVDGIRSISEENNDHPDLNGRSIKRRLLELQNPSTAKLSDKAIFAELQEFVRSVMDDPSVTIDIPYDLSTIHVTQDGRTLPIENLGTGIHEVVIIAAAATVTQNSILCIEEPEVHLHPILQRKLLRHLAEHTTNQYFIATHSAHLLDSALGNIFHVSIDNGVSHISYAGSARERSAICADLGYRPSDLVQTNAILWIEGPSDRIYLKYWIEKLAPGEFVEGTHYTVMFYGGSLLNALSALDVEDVEDFISLRHLNRYMAILIDSDKNSEDAALNTSKTRVVDELSRDPSTGLAWVTAGYTIENYVPDEVLESAISAAHPSTAYGPLPVSDKWSNPLAPSRLRIKQPSKIAIAKKAVEYWGDAGWPLDLEEKVTTLIEFIRTANRHG